MGEYDGEPIVSVCRRAGAMIAAVLLIATAAQTAGGGQAAPPCLVPQYSHAIPAVGFSFSRSGRLAVSNGEGLVDIWDVASRALIGTLTIPELSENPGASAVALSPDGRTLAHADMNGSVQLWDVATGRPGRTLPEPVGRPDRVAWSPDGRLVAAGGSTVRLWDAATGKLARTFPVDGDIAFSDDGKLLAAVDGEKAYLFNPATGKLIRTFSDSSGLMPPITISPDKTLLATGGEDPKWHPDIVAALESETAHSLKVKVWNARTGKLVRMLPGHWNRNSGADVLQFMRDNRTLFSAGSDYSAFWNVKTGKMRSFPGCGPVSPDGKVVATGENRLVLLSAATGKSVFQAPPPPAHVRAAAFSPDGRLLATGGERLNDCGLWLWNVENGALSRAIRTPPSNLHDVGFLPGGRVMSNSYGDASIWDASTGKLVMTRTGPMGESPVGPQRESSLLSPDASLMVSESGGPFRQSFQVRDARTNEILRTIPVGRGMAFESAFSPDGRYFVARVGLSPRRMQVFDLTNGQEVSRLEGDDNQYAASPTFSADGAIIAGAVESGIVLWARDSGKVLLRIPAAQGLTSRHPYPEGWEKGRAGSLAFAPDGRTIAAGFVGEVRLYDTTAGSEKGRLQGGDEVFRCVTFSPDGARIAAGNEAGQIYVWDVKSRRQLTSMVALTTLLNPLPPTTRRNPPRG